MTAPELNPDQEAQCRRLAISHGDIDDACGYASRLKDLPPRTSGERSPLIVEREALLIALIVSYARPFKRNAVGDNTAPSLDVESVISLAPEQARLHRHLITLRDKHFAHADPGPLQLSLREESGIGTVALMKEPRPPISPSAAAEYLSLAEAVRDAIVVRLRDFGVEAIVREG